MDRRTKFIYTTKYGSLTFSENSDFWITDLQGISNVTIETFQSQSPKQIGSTLTGQSIQPRTITIDGCFFGNLVQNRAQIINTFIPGETATLTVVPPVGDKWFITVVPTQTPAIELGEGSQDFQATLFAPYPCWQTVAEQIQEVGQIMPMFKFPHNTAGNWWISRKNNEQYKTIYNDGNIPVGFAIRIFAANDCKGPRIIHTGSGKTIAVNLDFKMGESIYISTVQKQEKITLYKKDGTQINGFRHLSMDSDLTMKLLPGENLLHFDAEENYKNFTFAVIAPKGVKTGV